MHFNISALLLVSGLAAAMNTAPRLKDPRTHLATCTEVFSNPGISILPNNGIATYLLDHIVTDQDPPTCNLNSCSSLSNTINCVMSAIKSGDPAALQKCLTTGLDDVCLLTNKPYTCPQTQTKPILMLMTTRSAPASPASHPY